MSKETKRQIVIYTGSVYSNPMPQDEPTIQDGVNKEHSERIRKLEARMVRLEGVYTDALHELKGMIDKNKDILNGDRSGGSPGAVRLRSSGDSGVPRDPRGTPAPAKGLYVFVTPRDTFTVISDEKGLGKEYVKFKLKEFERKKALKNKDLAPMGLRK